MQRECERSTSGTDTAEDLSIVTKTCSYCKIFPMASQQIPTLDLFEASSVREQKKRSTRRALHLSALRLVLEHGLAGVTTDDIARAAGVSPRTFFNYFPTKEASLVGMPEVVVERVSEYCANRPDDEPAWQTARSVAALLLHLSTDDDDLRRNRRTLMAHDPETAALMLGSSRVIDAGLTEALVTRVDAGPVTTQPWRARMMAHTALDAARVATELGDDPHDAMSILQEILDAHDALYA